MTLKYLSFIAAVVAFFTLSSLGAQERRGIPPQDRDNPLKELIPGYAFGDLKTRALQDDEFDNPGYRWLEQGEALWSTVDGSQQKSCTTCHGAAAQTMKGVGASYPKLSPASNKVVNLEQRINACRQDKMSAAPWKYDGAELIAMTAFVRNQSRGLATAVAIDGPARPVFEFGRREYEMKIGQWNMACADCHNARYGQALRGETLSQGHGNGFPAYWLRDKTMHSLHDRFRKCNSLVRAEPRESGSDEYVALELYLAWRGKGLPIETPAVRE